MKLYQINIFKGFRHKHLCLHAGVLFLFLNSFVCVSLVFAKPMVDFICVQTPQNTLSQPVGINSVLQNRYINGCKIVRFSPSAPSKSPVYLAQSFVSAMDPSVSFDGKTILFSGKKKTSNPWHIYQMNIDGSNIIQITNGKNDHFSPLYVGTLFYLNDKHPIGQIIYVKEIKDQDQRLAIFASNTDGSNPRQITFNMFSDFSPDVLPNGRLVFPSLSLKQKTGTFPVSQLLAANIDGTDLMPFTGDQSYSFHQLMPRSGFDKRLYYIESNSLDYMKGGVIASVSHFRSLHSRKTITDSDDGIFHTPCPLPDGRLLVSYRNNANNSLYAIYSMDPANKTSLKKMYASDQYHFIDSQLLIKRTQARGRSSVVGFKYKDTGVFFCMNVYNTDRSEISQHLKPGSVKKVLITQGDMDDQLSIYHRIIGEAPVEKDGSFHVRVPAEIPLTFHLLDKNGITLAKQETWTWVMHGENRGCIGCHEDRELSPPNHFVDAIKKKEVKLTPTPDQRKIIEWSKPASPYVLKESPTSNVIKE